MSTYLGLRNLALSNPFAVLMDLPTTQHTATVVAYEEVRPVFISAMAAAIWEAVNRTKPFRMPG